MSSCATGNIVTKFTITKGVTNTFFFTIKQNGSTLPITIDDADTFTAILKDLETDTAILTKSMTVESALNGKVKFEVTSSETDGLTKLRGGKEDRYYPVPVYTLLLLCNTVANGEFIARVSYVYVD